MQLTGFEFSDYERLLDTALANGWHFCTVEDYLRGSEPEEPFVVLRHDVDRRVETAVEMATVEADHDVHATYYFRENTFDPETAQLLTSQGHEIGYHYEDFVKTGGDHRAAHDRFAENLAEFRQHVDVTTVCSHGNPLSPHTNTEMWRDGPDFAEYDLLGEAYLSIDYTDQQPTNLLYLSDTGRDWNVDFPGFGRVRTTDDVTAFIEDQPHTRLYMLVHPCRWSTSRLEFLERSSWDIATETVKSLVKRVHHLQRAYARSGQ